MFPSLLLAQTCASVANPAITYASELITQVSIGTDLTPYSISCTGYTDNTNLSLSGYQSGSTIPFVIYTNKCAGFTTAQNLKGCKIFMDWNDDGDFFDADETVYISYSAFSWTSTFTAYVTVPQYVQCANIRTRIVYARLINPFFIPQSINPCGMYSYGETEDYIIPIESCFQVEAGDDAFICEEDTVTLNPQIVQGASYSWSPINNISNPNTSSPEVYPNSTTTYLLTVDSAGFLASDSVTVYVYPNPVISASANQDVCNGGTPTDIFVNSIPGASYSWTPNTNLSTPTNFQTAFSSGLTDTTLFYVDVSLAGCNSIDSVQINVNPLPECSLTVTPNPACVGDDLSVLALTSIPVLRYRFQYDIGNGWQNYVTTNTWGWGTQNPITYGNIVTNMLFRVRVREDFGCNTGPWSPTLSVPIINIITPPIIHY